MPTHPSRTLAIAKALGLNHPMQSNGVPKILLTSFVLTMADSAGKPLDAARSLLPVPKRAWSAQQIRERLTTLEILRVHWKMQDMPWSIVSAHRAKPILERPCCAGGVLYRSLRDHGAGSRVKSLRWSRMSPAWNHDHSIPAKVDSDSSANFGLTRHRSAGASRVPSAHRREVGPKPTLNAAARAELP